MKKRSFPVQRKRLLAALLLCAMLPALAACGGEEQPGPEVEVISADDVSTADELIAAEEQAAQQAEAEAGDGEANDGENIGTDDGENTRPEEPQEAADDPPQEPPGPAEPDPVPAEPAPVPAEPDPVPAEPAPVPQKLSIDQALAIALAHAGLSGNQVTVTKAELDTDDSVAEYEIEFLSGGFEYEYEIDAYSGAILEWERDED